MNFLITGGAGFIGSHLVDDLLVNGNKVFCLDNFDDFYSPEIKRSNIEHHLNHPGFVLLEEDIRNAGFLEKFFSQNKIDTVMHFAARAGVRPSIKNPKLYYEVNVGGTLCLLEVMKKAGVTKMIFASSSSVYGNNKKIPFSESDAVDFPVSPYAASKRAAELLCYTFHHLHGFDIFCLRFFTVYGPRQRPEMAIHLFTENILQGKPVLFFGNGSSQRDYTYIDDIISGITAAIKNLRGFEIINLGESQTISLADLISVIENHTGKKAFIRHLPEQPGDVLATHANIDKAAKLLNYYPKVSIDEGIRKFINWYGSRANVQRTVSPSI